MFSQNGNAYPLEIDGKIINIYLWDTHNDPNGYDRLRPLSYPQTDVFILCFSMNNRYSFQSIKQRLEPEIHHHCPGVPFIIVGCKRDLIDAQICSTPEDTNKLIHGYFRKYDDNNNNNYALKLRDIFGIIEVYLQKDYNNDKFVSDTNQMNYAQNWRI